jgi:DNA-binding LacI/PurR family transcriptional regulator
MKDLNARERAVVRALDELKRRGRIVRRRGSGTYVGRPGEAVPAAPMGAQAAANTIVVIARPDNGFFDDCISQLYSHADSTDYSIVYQLLRSADEPECSFEPVIGSAAGFILFGYYLAPLARSLMAAGNRVVIVGAPFLDERPQVPYVCNDHEAGGNLAVRHLIERGHRRIGFQFNCDREMRSPRWIGNRRGLDDSRRAGISVTETIIDQQRLDAWESDPASVRGDLGRPDSPTAIVAWNDFSAARILGVLQRAELRIPEDVSVIGYDNASIAERLTPPLTTIDSGVAQMLGAAIRTMQLPNAAEVASTQMTIPHLVMRESVGPPRS